MMVEPNQPPAKTWLDAIACIVPPMGAVLALSACGLLGALGGDPPVVSYEYRKGESFVRIESIEAGAPDNTHPFGISVAALTHALAGIQVEGGSSISAVPMFTEAELQEIVPHLVAALAKARPKEDIGFAVTGKHGFFGEFSPSSVTTGRLFVRDRRINVIFGLVQEFYEGGELEVDLSSLPTGSRTHRPSKVWRLVPKSGQMVEQRTDWVTLDAPTPSRPGTEAAKTGAPGTPTAEERYREFETRLAVLNRLKANGLITEEEYNERRRAILKGL